MSNDFPYHDLLGLPGINRDQTSFQTTNWVDGEAVRFYNGVPRKWGGYIVCNYGTPEVCRAVYAVSTQVPVGSETGVNTINLYQGRASSLSFLAVNNNAQSTASRIVTPDDYVVDPLNTWNFDQFTVVDVSGIIPPINYILAHVSPSSDDIGTIGPGATYYGVNGSTDHFIQIPDITLNGFVCVASPFIFIGGQNGSLRWNTEGRIDDWPAANVAAIGNTKLVKAMQIRGGSVQSILIWSLISLYRVTYNPDTTGSSNQFFKETISNNISIISPNTVVEVPEISSYFWMGRNCFYQYNGIVSELPNSFNKLWVFKNINRSYQERCWALHHPQYNEVLFFFPYGDSHECNHVAVYNYLGKFWYDSPLARSCGVSAQYLNCPIMADSRFSNPFITNYGQVHSFWMHEYGVDLEVGGAKFAIKSFVRSSDRMLMDLVKNGNIGDAQMRTRRFEADMFLDGQMSLQIYSKQFPSSPYEISRRYLLRDPTTGRVGKTDITKMGRINSFYFESNEVGGFYQFGNNIIDITPDGSERPAH